MKEDSGLRPEGVNGHSPMPWSVEMTADSKGFPQAFNIKGSDGNYVVGPEGIFPDVLDFARGEADAALIVKAVNLHDELVAALAVCPDWTEINSADDLVRELQVWWNEIVKPVLGRAK